MLPVGHWEIHRSRVTEYRGFELEVGLASTSEDMFDAWCTLDTHSTRPRQSCQLSTLMKRTIQEPGGVNVDEHNDLPPTFRWQ